MKNMKKVLSVLLALAMVLSLVACGSNTNTTTEGTKATTAATEATTEATTEEEEGPVYEYVSLEDFDEDAWDDLSDLLYENELGEYADALAAAVAETGNNSLRFALMAVAEAKLMESAVYVPATSNGGAYAISRVAPYTASNVLWGVDADRYDTLLIASDFIKPDDREAMKQKWAELKGTGTYMDWAKKYLEDNGYTLVDKYATTFTTLPKTWDFSNTYRAADTDYIIMGLDGLMRYNCEGKQEYALATDVKVSADGLTYTFTLRKDATWVDSQGRFVANVTANDFVFGMQKIIDNDMTASLLMGVIANAEEYYLGECDFEEVGVKAIDDYTLEYTLAEATPYFMSMLCYNCFFPLNQAYYEAQGENYGLSPENICYNGAYLCTSCIDQSIISFTANPTYYNKDAVNVKTVEFLYNDGSDSLKAYNDCLAGTITGTGLNAEALETAKKDGNFDAYSYISSTGSTSYGIFMNLYRTARYNFNDETVAVSGVAEEEYERTVAAMQNVHFRRAVAMSIDRISYNAQSTGDALAPVSVINSYTPGNFVALTEDVTIDINGTATTFKAGTYYGEIMQAQIDADEVAIQVWDPTGNSGDGSSAGFDGWYNAENAKAELAIAIEELATVGIVIDKDHPIHIEMSYPSVSTTYTNRANACAQSVAAALEGLVSYDLLDCESAVNWYYNGYYCEHGYQDNYDLYDCSGWDPDYGDPFTYLNTLSRYGDMIIMLGIN